MKKSVTLFLNAIQFLARFILLPVSLFGIRVAAAEVSTHDEASADEGYPRPFPKRMKNDMNALPPFWSMMEHRIRNLEQDVRNTRHELKLLKSAIDDVEDMATTTDAVVNELDYELGLMSCELEETIGITETNEENMEKMADNIEKLWSQLSELHSSVC